MSGTVLAIPRVAVKIKIKCRCPEETLLGPKVLYFVGRPTIGQDNRPGVAVTRFPFAVKPVIVTGLDVWVEDAGDG